MSKVIKSDIPQKGIVEMDGYRYVYEYMIAQTGDMCLSTKNPMEYCNGYHAYSIKDPGAGKCFVIIETDDPNVYPESEAIEVEDNRPVGIKHKQSDDQLLSPSLRPSGSLGTTNDPDRIAKWKPVLEQYGITDPYKQAWMADYCENHLSVDRENLANGKSIFGEGVKELFGEEASEKMLESAMFEDSLYDEDQEEWVTPELDESRPIERCEDHEWRSVYYGAEWEVECVHCDKNIFDVYPHEEAVRRIRLMTGQKEETPKKKSIIKRIFEFLRF